MDDKAKAVVAFLKEKIWPNLPVGLQKEIKAYDLVNLLALKETTAQASNNRANCPDLPDGSAPPGHGAQTAKEGTKGKSPRRE